MLRQFWIFVMPQDVDGLIRAVDEVDPGVAVARGRCFRGEPWKLLVPGEAEQLEYAPEGPESRLLLFHRRHSRGAIVHAGDRAGAHCIDERRSDCLVLRAPQPVKGTLAPACLRAETHLVELGQKVRKPPEFQSWAAAVFGALAERYAQTSASFIHVAPEAQAWALGGGRLHYLFEPVLLSAGSAQTPVFEPHRKHAPRD